MSFFLVGDEIFLLKYWLMQPYADKELKDKTKKKLTTGSHEPYDYREHFWYFGIKIEDLSEANRRYSRKDQENRSCDGRFT